MKRTFQICLILLIQLLWFNDEILAQSYSLAIKETALEMDSVALTGYETRFGQSTEAVKKAWWKYIKSKAIIENHLTHLELKIPAKDRNSNKPIYLVSKLSGTDSSDFRILAIALRTHNLETSQVGKIDQDVKKMLLEFKTNYYVTSIEEKIEVQEKLAKKLSAQLDKLRNSKYREEMDSALFEAKENGIMFGLKQVDQNLDSLKHQLLEIK